ncbi:hypothetical protein CEXT_801011 [Caerostris extrusa]|uniref:Uncharacterized protein n=1 Tax=Caerostris extrusa TaxID=172846 RepID=A0AAV4WLU5_CAEEX|nr:hypothetical protein CEXT_801011 [Caerostris extrusa]
MQPDVWNVMPPNTPKNTSAHGGVVCVVMRAAGASEDTSWELRNWFAKVCRFEEKAAERAADKINGSETSFRQKHRNGREKSEKDVNGKKSTRCHFFPENQFFTDIFLMWSDRVRGACYVVFPNVCACKTELFTN